MHFWDHKQREGMESRVEDIKKAATITAKVIALTQLGG